ncbi:Hypothetical protein PBC10988_19840 [Planctomycetales bacterium 10988]|nr:Hypothetical protein PBC10988_19840 [Planctomycetales bacterium 10988]
MPPSPKLSRLAIQQSRKFTTLYILALSMIALLTFCGFGIIQYVISTQENDSSVINLAGRQRMLSQRISKLALLFQREAPQVPKAYLDEFEIALENWKTNHEGLRDRKGEIGLAGVNSSQVKSMFQSLDASYLPMRDAADELLERLRSGNANPKEINTLVEKVLEQEQPFLTGMDEIVFQYDVEATQRVSSLKLLETAVVVISLLVLLLEGFFIFRPAVQKIQSGVQSLQEANELLGEAKEKAEFANQAKSRFLASMSHELRTPMNAVLGLTSVLLRSELSDRQKELMKTIHRSAQNLMNLLNDLLDLSKVEAGKTLELIEKPFAVKVLIQEVAQLFLIQTENKNIDLRCEISNRIPDTLFGDTNRIRQIVTNLLNNAIKFTDHGSIVVALDVFHETDEEIELILSVKDTGVGISLEDQRRVFDTFTQVDESIDRRYHGAGLGLNICVRIIQAMQGGYDLSSTPGVGSEFRFFIPLRKAPQADITSTQPTNTNTIVAEEPKETRKLHLLVAEDNPANQMVVTEYLNQLGHSCKMVQNGMEASMVCFKEVFDLIFMDIQMPYMDGLTATKKIRQREQEEGQRPRIIVAMTAHARPQDRRDSEQAGMNDYITKPVSFEQITTLLAKYSLMKEAVETQNISADQKPLPTELPTEKTDAAPKAALSSDVGSSLSRLKNRLPLLRRLATVFFQDVPGQLSELRLALDAQDWKKAKFHAHRIRGGAALFSAQETIDLASALEEMLAQPAEPAVIEHQFQLFEASLAELKETLSDLLTPSPSEAVDSN